MSLYHHKWFPRIFHKKPDGGKDSGVTGYFLIEWKCLFSVALLHFTEGSREAYHSHAFHALTWWLGGTATEERIDGTYAVGCRKTKYKRSIIPKLTLRSNIHRVVPEGDCWAFTLRGPWLDYWYEFTKGKRITLTHGRKVV